MSQVKQAERAASLRRFKPYPAYKDSDVEWLGEIPAHWNEKRVHQASSRVTDGAHISPDTSSPDFPFVSTVDIKGGTIDFDSCLRTSASSYAYMKRTGCTPQRGDVLFSKDGTVGLTALVTVDREFAVASSLVIISPDAKQIDSRWLGYWLNSAVVRDTVDLLLSGAALRRISVAKVGRLPLLLPPRLDEQRAIAAFLDRETAKIDALASKKEQLIELLQEKRTALITRAVTKGLDPNVPMKDSGVEWLGEIPAQWTTKPLKHVADFINGFAFKLDEWGLEGTPIIRIENLNAGEDFNYTARELPAKYCADKGDLLFGWSGNRGTSFGPFLWWRAGRHYVNQHIFRIVNFDVDKTWLCWMLRGVTFYVEKQAHGIIGMVHITRGELGSIPVPVLPREEQEQIARYLEKEHTKIDALVARVREGIERLREYRTALISAVVTGRIDVRKEAA